MFQQSTVNNLTHLSSNFYQSLPRPQLLRRRHTFATLLQDTNVDPLIRQITLGHSPKSAGGLGMTARYTHSRAETQRRQVEQALRQWPDSLLFAAVFFTEVSHGDGFSAGGQES